MQKVLQHELSVTRGSVLPREKTLHVLFYGAYGNNYSRYMIQSSKYINSRDQHAPKSSRLRKQVTGVQHIWRHSFKLRCLSSHNNYYNVRALVYCSVVLLNLAGVLTIEFHWYRRLENGYWSGGTKWYLDNLALKITVTGLYYQEVPDSTKWYEVVPNGTE